MTSSVVCVCGSSPAVDCCDCCDCCDCGSKSDGCRDDADRDFRFVVGCTSWESSHALPWFVGTTSSPSEGSSSHAQVLKLQLERTGRPLLIVSSLRGCNDTRTFISVNKRPVSVRCRVTSSVACRYRRRLRRCRSRRGCYSSSTTDDSRLVLTTGPGRTSACACATACEPPSALTGGTI